MKKGLIMEGGAMRGMFTAGVVDVMMENKIVFDGAAGVSAGAVFGINSHIISWIFLVSGQQRKLWCSQCGRG